jgi:hypothetical protein
VQPGLDGDALERFANLARDRARQCALTVRKVPE